MAKNFVQPGRTVTLTAPGAVTSGGGVHVGSLFGIAAYDAAQGADVEVALEGVFELPKDGSTINPGDAVYWTGAAVSTSVGSGDVLVGAAVAAASGSATSVRVRLNGATVS